MTPMKGFSVLALCAATLPALPVVAGDWYLVGNLGEATYKDIERDQRGNALIGSPWAVPGDPLDILVTAPAQGIGADTGGEIIAPGLQADKDDTDTTWRIGGGYQVNAYFAVEVAYMDAGEAKVEATLVGPAFTPAPPFYQRETITYEATGVEVSGLGQYPISERFQVLGRLGIIYLEQEMSSRIRFDPVDPSAPGFGPVLLDGLGSDRERSDFKPLVGVGLQYQVLEPLAVRLEWMRYLDAIDLGSSEKDIDSLSLGIRYAF